ncbi:MAG: hypothetical protein IKF38_02510 [Clostridia bacterium]|nr:hypothetical protein [Clostridia bacterium]
MLKELIRKTQQRDYIDRIISRGIEELTRCSGQTTVEELTVIVEYDVFYWRIIRESWKEIQKKAKKKGVRVKTSQLKTIKNHCLIFSYID